MWEITALEFWAALRTSGGGDRLSVHPVRWEKIIRLITLCSVFAPAWFGLGLYIVTMNFFFLLRNLMHCCVLS